jgi:hypothetical protein
MFALSCHCADAEATTGGEQSDRDGVTSEEVG